MFGETPMGGTELMVNKLYQLLPNKLLEEYDITHIPREIAKGKKGIMWWHLSYDQELVQVLKDRNNYEKFDKHIFVSNWQYEKFRYMFGVDGDKSIVLKNAIVPIQQHIKPRGNIHLIYTSTPNRGLKLLIKAFKQLNRDDIELDVYSSFKVYGTGYNNIDKEYNDLYEICKNTKNINYYGSKPNSDIRLALTNAHIFAYPCIFEETSCISVIEAMSAGCTVVTNNLGALPETCGEFANMYSYDSNEDRHIEKFTKLLDEAINNYFLLDTQEKLKQQIVYYNTFYSWNYRIREWIKELT